MPGSLVSRMGLIAALLASAARRAPWTPWRGCPPVRECETGSSSRGRASRSPFISAVFDLYADGRTNFDRFAFYAPVSPGRAPCLRGPLRQSRPGQCSTWPAAGSTTSWSLGVDDDPASLRAHVDKAEARSAAAIVRPAVARLPTVVRDAVLAAVTRAHERLTAETLARRLATSRRDLTQALLRADYRRPTSSSPGAVCRRRPHPRRIRP